MLQHRMPVSPQLSLHESVAFVAALYAVLCTLADDDRDVDLYHWSSSKFSAAWLDTLSVLVARGRA
eukprot:COSAG02_NODE_29320_length_571_cov_1.298729_1_plen_65_part_10